jgi:SOS response regulatory protein OraA/RecX
VTHPDPAPGLFGGEGETVTDLRPDTRDPTLTHVYVARRKAASVPTSRLAAMGLAPGAPWTPDLARACAHALDVRRARRKAAGLLRHGERALHELTAALEAAGFTPAAAREAVDDLSRSGLASDARAAEREIDRRLRRGPVSRESLEARLLARGIDPALAREALDRATGDEPESDRALRAAFAIFESLPDDLSVQAVWRRVRDGLARRGFDPEASLDAARRVLGDPPDDAEP